VKLGVSIAMDEAYESCHSLAEKDDKSNDGKQVVLALVQARTSSLRLPAKVLKPFGDTHVIGSLLDGLAQAKEIDGYVVCTSAQTTDDELVRLVEQKGHCVHRGSLHNVLERLFEAGRVHSADAVVRVSADSPILLPSLIDRAVLAFREGDFDLVTNVQKRTYPKGQSVEVLSMALLKATLQNSPSEAAREHVTPDLYDNATHYRIHSIESGSDWGGIRMCVDTQEDYRNLQALQRYLERPYWTYSLEKLVDLLHESQKTHA
jgi:spore coat polysaccharide biosynthesis protein SpsF